MTHFWTGKLQRVVRFCIYCEESLDFSNYFACCNECFDKENIVPLPHLHLFYLNQLETQGRRWCLKNNCNYDELVENTGYDDGKGMI